MTLQMQWFSKKGNTVHIASLFVCLWDQMHQFRVCTFWLDLGSRWSQFSSVLLLMFFRWRTCLCTLVCGLTVWYLSWLHMAEPPVTKKNPIQCLPLVSFTIVIRRPHLVCSMYFGICSIMLSKLLFPWPVTSFSQLYRSTDSQRLQQAKLTETQCTLLLNKRVNKKHVSETSDGFFSSLNYNNVLR